MENSYITYHVQTGKRHLMIVKSEDAVDIRITKYTRKDPINIMSEEVEEELNIPISLEAYNKLVNELWKSL